MILSDCDIKKVLKEGRLVVKPLDDPDEQIQPCWIDLRLGNEFRIFKPTSVSIVDTKTPVDGYTEKIRIKDGEPFVMHPGEFVLGMVKEYIKMPDDLMGVVDGRSSLGRLGIIVHTTSAGINPGWEGEFTLEMSNVGKIPVTLYPGMRICKLVLHKLSSPAERPYNMRKNAKYQKQSGIDESKIFKDFSQKK
jgi:dCTP deaminase